jgi:AcrR family transcriptional regulator
MVMLKPNLKNKLLDAAEAVVVRQGIGDLTLDAVAAEAGLSKGGLLHYFPSKDDLIAAMVKRSADNFRNCYMQRYENTPGGPGRMSRALLGHCLSEGWSDQLKESSSAVFAALAENPSLIQPMREVYSELLERVQNDGLPQGVGETIAAAIDGLWMYWVLGLAPVDKDRIERVHHAINTLLLNSTRTKKSANRKKKLQKTRRSGGRRI